VSLARLLEATEAACEIEGGPVTIVGHSLGGTLARAAAALRPDLVRQVITLGSPLREIVAHPLVVAAADYLQSRLVSPQDRPRKHGDHVHSGECYAETIRALSEPFPEGVGRSAIYTRSDGIVDWRTTREDDADNNIEVHGSHVGLVVNREVYAVLARLLNAGSRSEQREKSEAHR
jgi:pimeloyl-ACP methyl ester carboxylesterase